MANIPENIKHITTSGLWNIEMAKEYKKLGKCDCGWFHTCYQCGAMCHVQFNKYWKILDGLFKDLVVCQDCK